MAKRDNSVTIAKGIAIILMVMGHAQCPEYLSFQNTILMPLFFFMSGYCFKNDYLLDCKKYIKRRITGIYKPYVKWSLIILLFHNLFFSWGISDTTFINGNWQPEPSHLFSIKEYLVTALNIVTGMSGEDQLLGGYWFLNSLFFGSLIFYFFAHIRKPFLQLSLLLALTVITKYFWIAIPWVNVSAREFLAAFFIMSGYVYRNKQYTIHKNIYYSIPLFGLVIIATKFVNTSMHLFWWKNAIPFALIGLCGTLAIFMISSKLSKKNGPIIDALTYTGNHTFQVLTWHLIVFKLVTLLLIITMNLPMNLLVHYPVILEAEYKFSWVIYTVFGVIIPLFGMKIYEKMTIRKQLL